MELDKINTLCILGNRDEGKTNLAFYYLNKYKGNKQKVLYGYPKKIEGFKVVSTFDDLLKVNNSVIFIDEISIYFKFYDKHTSQRFLDFLVLMAHKKNTLIFTAQLTQMITKPIEALIDAWSFKRIDLTTLKYGSKPKRIIQSLADYKKNEWVLDLEKNEYFEYSERNEENGIKTFNFQNVGKDWL